MRVFRRLRRENIGEVMRATRNWTGLVLVILIAAGCVTSPLYRPGQEFRTINAAEYEIAVQKNGRVDVLLRSGQVLLANAQPMVWYADEDKPEALPIMGRVHSLTPTTGRCRLAASRRKRKSPCRRQPPPDH